MYSRDIPALEGPQRFGNKAFRVWMHRLNSVCLLFMQIDQKESYELVKNMISDAEENSLKIHEIAHYLVNAFGNETRIDYVSTLPNITHNKGSGHELSFIAFLLTLFLVGFINTEDLVAIGTKVFPHYIEICRSIQTQYMLEPAGSHGVWGLDDFQFLTYYWGSSQLISKTSNSISNMRS